MGKLTYKEQAFYNEICYKANSCNSVYLGLLTDEQRDLMFSLSNKGRISYKALSTSSLYSSAYTVHIRTR